MHATLPSALDSAVLAQRLSELVGHERAVLVEFLLHLEEYDRRKAWLEAGYDSLWNYCQRALLLREGPTALRIAAMRVLRRFPVVAEMLREGRLCLSTVRLLDPVLTGENAADVLARAAGKSKLDVERLVVSIQPRPIPREGIRKLPSRAEAVAPALGLPPAHGPESTEAPNAARPAPPVEALAPASRALLTPVAKDTHTLTVTVDEAFLAEIDELKALLSHKVPSGNLGALLREAVRCTIDKYGKRRGAVEPTRKRGEEAPAPERPGSERRRGPIPAAVKREVYKRDGGRCTHVGPDGKRCGSRWKLEFHHLEEVALGGRSTVENVTMRCRPHNVHAAEETFGREHMDQFRRRDMPRMSESTDSGISARDARPPAQPSLFEAGWPATPERGGKPVGPAASP